MTDFVSKYKLVFKDLASKRLLKVSKVATGMTKALKTSAKAIGGVGLATLAASQLVNKALSEQISLAQSVGASHKDFDALIGISKRLGFEFDNVIDLQEELNNKVGEFKALGELTSLEEGLGALKINVKEFVKLNPAEQLEALFKASAKVDAQIGSAAADMLLGGEANKIFGKFRQELDASGLSVDAYFDKQRALNQLTEEGRRGALAQIRSTSSLTMFLSTLAQDGFGRLGLVISPIIDRLTDFLVKNKELIRTKIDEFMAKISEAADKIDFERLFTQGGKFIQMLVSKTGGVITFIDKIGGLGTILKTLLGVMVVGKVLEFGAALSKIPLILGVIGKAAKALFLIARVGLLFNPIGLAMTAVIGIGVLLWKNWDKVKAKALSMGIDLDKIFGSIKDTIKTAFKVVAAGTAVMMKGVAVSFKFIGKVFGVGKSLLLGYFNLYKIAGQKIMGFVGVALSGFSKFKSGSAAVFGVGKSLLMSYFNVYKVGGSKLVEFVGGALTRFNQFKVGSQKTFNGALGHIGEFVNGADPFLSLMGKKFDGLRLRMFGAFRGLGDFLKGVWSGFKSILASGVNFYIAQINKVLAVYNRAAGSGIGRRLGVSEVDLVKNINVNTVQNVPSNDRGPIEIELKLDGKVDGADVKIGASSNAGNVNIGSNMPLGRVKF